MRPIKILEELNNKLSQDINNVKLRLDKMGDNNNDKKTFLKGKLDGLYSIQNHLLR